MSTKNRGWLRSGISPEFGFRPQVHLTGGAFSAAQTQVANILTEQYAAKFEAGFSTAVATRLTLPKSGNIAKAYQSVAPTGNKAVSAETKSPKSLVRTRGQVRE